ncbi:MAG TPA: 2'-5' RNA ligase family protein [Fimbriimonadaceae bacterium]|nr:2'-5' RNA ligase family protein [Fimbriimonadaceae bacterium]
MKLESIEGVVVARQPHVTMAFLGDVPDAVVPILGERLARLAVRIRPLHLMIDGRGAFPNRNRPRVLW